MNKSSSVLRKLKFLPKRANGTRIADVGPAVSSPMEIKQDVAPEGGYPPVRMRRNMPNKFWTIGTTSLLACVMMGYGWYRYYKWLLKKEELKKEREGLEVAMIPFLQAENDIAFTIQRRAFLKKVEELMKDETNFDAYQKFYNSTVRFQYPAYDARLEHFKGTGLLESEKKH
ncbi:hypothetical protein ABK040_008406 [Willaertia magna]